MINRSFSGFSARHGTVIDMTPDGAFVAPVRTQPSLGTVVARLIGFGLLLGIAAVTFWAALFIIPTLILLGLAAFAVTRLVGRGSVNARGLRRY